MPDDRKMLTFVHARKRGSGCDEFFEKYSGANVKKMRHVDNEVNIFLKKSAVNIW